MQLLTGLTTMLSKMIENKSFIFGSIAAVVSAFFTKLTGITDLDIIHIQLMGILIGIILCDYLLGNRIAKKNKTYESGIAIDALIRDGIMIALSTVCYLVDQVLGTGALIFAIFVFALCYHNVQSIVANIYVIGWQKHFPIWLFNWVDSEIRAKFQRIETAKESGGTDLDRDSRTTSK